MAKTNAKKSGYRFITGEVDRVSLGEMKEHNVDGKTWSNYQIHVKGFYEDTMTSVDEYFHTGYQPTVFFNDDEDQMLEEDIKEKVDGHVFLGRVALKVKEVAGEEKCYLHSVQVQELKGVDEFKMPNIFNQYPAPEIDANSFDFLD